MYKLNKELVISSKSSDMGNYRGKKVKVIEILPPSNANDYIVEFGNGHQVKVREDEVAEIKQEYLQKGISTDDVVEYIPTNEEVLIVEIDYLYGKVEIRHTDTSQHVVDLDVVRKIEQENISFEDSSDTPNENKTGKFTEIALEIGQFTDIKNKQYGSSVDATYEMIKVLMDRYTYDENNYLMPKSLLKHILLQVRMMDKQNRIFNNPSGEGDSESPYKDLCGYSLIGIDMVGK